jgi:protein-disulfide isomerase
MRTRRDYLLGLGAAGTAALAGCTGSPGSGGDDSTDGGNGGDDGNSLANHPAAAGLDAQPVLGPAPSEAKAVVVAFEDPSCPRCRTFEQNTAPKIKSELVDTGDAAFVFRGYPIVYDWGKPAVRALEATSAESAETHWRLVAHYFDQQSDYRSAGREQVYPRTESFLNENTDLDGSAVVSAAANGEFESAVQTDLDAGEAASIRATPTVLLFRDGQFRTSYSGSVDFESVRTALGL